MAMRSHAVAQIRDADRAVAVLVVERKRVLEFCNLHLVEVFHAGGIPE
jgi:hypothetical protein